MSLSSALNTAKSSLVATQTHTQLVSRNIANLNTVGATRKYANVVTGAGGRVEVNSIAQSQNSVLFRNMLDSTSSLARTQTVADGLTRISETIGDPELGRSPAALVASLKDKLDAAAKLPNNYELARAATQAAQDLATSLNQGAATVQTIREDADAELVAAAKSMTEILSRIQTLNDKVIAGTTGGTDVTDFVDQRDQAVAELSEYVGVNVQIRANNDMAIYTDSGVTLFDKSARPVEFRPSGALPMGQAGNQFVMDGVVVTGDNAFMPIKTGKIAGLVELRDVTAVTYGQQLDEIAKSLVTAFSEGEWGHVATGQPGLATQPGLFTSAASTLTNTVSSLSVGTFDAGKMADGDSLTFRFSVDGTVFEATGTIAAADFASADAYADKLQALIAGASVVSGTGTLKPTVVNQDGQLSLRVIDGGSTAHTISLSAIVSKAAGAASGDPHDPTKDGGLVAAAAGAVTTTAVKSTPATTGLAASISVSAAAVTNPFLLRDGVNGSSYGYNSASLAGFTGRLNGLSDALSQSRSYSTTLGAATDGTIAEFAASSFGWLEANRAQTTSDSEYKQTLLGRTQETLSDTTGINLAEEMTLLIDLERSYQASSKLISTIDEMLAALLQAV
jgi:flagellar hook-associated protein FlgK